MRYFYEPTSPIATDKGIKAKSKRGAFVKNWWASRWIESLTRLMDRGRLQRGKRYARKGQVIALDETKNGIEAKVQGSRRTPYKVKIQLKTLTNRQWDKVIQALSERAIFSAKLLAGEMPAEIEQVFDAVGVSLFPDARGDLTTSCSCPDYAEVCKHLAATHYILGERFDEDPFLLFRLRGRSEQQIMQTLRQSAPSAEAPTFDPAPSLEDSLLDVWQAPQPIMHFATHLKPPVTPMPILKRLGQPRFVSSDLEVSLAPAYNAVSEQILKTVFDSEDALADESA